MMYTRPSMETVAKNGCQRLYLPHVRVYMLLIRPSKWCINFSLFLAAEVVEEVEYKGHRIWASRAADDENNNRNTPSTSFGGGYGGQGPRKLTI